MPSDEEERRAYRRRLGVNLERIRTTMTTLTQQDIADRLKVDKETYARWERGAREPKAYDLHRIADEYGVPSEWLIEPLDSITEIDRRIATLRRVAAEAAAADAADEIAQQVATGEVARRGTR